MINVAGAIGDDGIPSRISIDRPIYDSLISAKERCKHGWDNVYILSALPGMGKTQVKGNIVLMSDGSWKKVEDIKVGDEVISPQKNGDTVFEKVSQIHSRFENKIYDITEIGRNKKILYSCSFNHEIPVIIPKIKRASKKNSTPKIYGRQLKIWDAEKISKSCYGTHLSSFTTPAMEFKNSRDLKIDPYCLGAWLGDGTFTKDLRIISDDIEIMNGFFQKYKIMSVDKKIGTTAKSYRFSLNGEFAKQLEELGLRYKTSGIKFIPKECLTTSINYRLNLLAGLIDTDGYISKNNATTICTKSKKLAEDIKNLVFSVGGYSLVRKIYKNCQSFKEKRLYYDVSVQFKNPKIVPLRLKRKFERLMVRKIDPRNISIKSVKRKSGAMVYGFSLSGESKLYVTNNHMVTHNSQFGICTMAQILAKKNSSIYIEFDIDKFIDRCASEKTKSESVVILDEGHDGMNTGNVARADFQRMVNLLMLVRMKKLHIIIITQNFFDIAKSIAIFRSNLLFFITTTKKGRRGSVVVFDRQKKKALYLIGRKTLNFQAVKGNYVSQFNKNDHCLPEDYIKRKAKHLIDQNKLLKEGGSIKRMDIAKKIMDNTILNLTKLNFKQKDIAKIMGIGGRTVVDHWSKMKKRGLVPEEYLILTNKRRFSPILP